MATYVGGVSSYIPALQHYQPDLNLLANVLEKKQNQYDKNFNAINDIYGKYFYADLSRDDNRERKDAMLKQIDLELKRISGLDLSLSQNVDQAVQVFKPFYEDSLLMKDMATTKNYKSRRASAEALKNSTDKDKKDQYWVTGIKKMDYEMEEFKTMPLEQTLGFQDPTYTAYKNPAQLYAKLAKDAELSVDLTKPTPDGMYFIRKKNGELLIDPLNTLFSSAAANDPALQEIYYAQSYVKRKDATYANKDKYGGLEASERAYLMDEYKKVQEFNKQFNENSANSLNNRKIIKDKVDKAYDDDSYTERTGAASEALQESIQNNEIVANQAKELDETLSDGTSSSAVTTNGVEFDINDIDELRRRVDYAKSIQFMQDDINAAVRSHMDKGRVEDIEVNPVGLEGLRHKNSMSRMHAKNAMDLNKIYTKHGLNLQTMEYKAQLEMHNFAVKENVKNKVLQVNPDGSTTYTPEFLERIKWKNSGGTADGSKGGTLEHNDQFLSDEATDAAPLISEILKVYSAIDDKVEEEYKADVNAAKTSSRYANVTEGSNEKRAVGTEGDYRRDDYVDYLTDASIFGDYAAGKGVKGVINDLSQDAPGTMLKLDLNSALKDFKFNVSRGLFKGVPEAEAILKDPNFFKVETYADLLGDMEKITAENTEIARKELSSAIDIRQESFVDRPWYNFDFTKNDVDVDIYSDQQFTDLNKRLAALALQSTSAGMTSKEQFLQNIKNDKTKISGNQTAWDMISAIETARHQGESGFMSPVGWVSTEPKQGGFLSAAAAVGRGVLNVAKVVGAAGSANAGRDALVSGGGPVPDIIDIIHDKYTAIWDTKKTANIYKSFLPKSGIPGASGADMQLDASTYNGINILPDAYGTPNRTLWSETMADVRRINWNDTENNKISLTGANAGTANEIDKGLQVLNALDGLVQKGGDTALGLKVFAGQIANNDFSKGAMVIMPTFKQLQDLGLVKGTSDDDGKLLTQKEANLMAQQGISVISRRNNFQNWLFKESEVSPMEARLNVAGASGIKYDDPFGNGYFTTKPVLQNGAATSFNIMGKIRQLNPQGKEEWQDVFIPNVPLGGNIDQVTVGLKQDFINIDNQNNKIFRQFNPNPKK